MICTSSQYTFVVSYQLTLFTMQFVARLTTDIIQTFEQCNPEFKYSEALNPKRFLTNPSTPAHNDGLDNANWDLILYVNLELVNKTSNRRFDFSQNWCSICQIFFVSSLSSFGCIVIA